MHPLRILQAETVTRMSPLTTRDSERPTGGVFRALLELEALAHYEWSGERQSNADCQQLSFIRLGGSYLHRGSGFCIIHRPYLNQRPTDRVG